MTALVFSMAVLSGCARRGVLHPEAVRKLLHVGTGLMALPFPWFFHSLWPVVLLAVLASLWMVAVRRFTPLRRYFGDALSGVQRASWGEFYFAVGVALAFWMAHGEALLFWAPVLVLTLADACGALVGVRYGRRRYGRGVDAKSVEGSLAFAGVTGAVICTMLLLSGLDAARAVPFSLLLALPLTLVEALARRGLDNLLVPLAASLLLRGVL
jgi:phytol kinase